MPSHIPENTPTGREPTYDLDLLLDAMSPETFPEEGDFGRPEGQEVW